MLQASVQLAQKLGGREKPRQGRLLQLNNRLVPNRWAGNAPLLLKREDQDTDAKMTR